MMAWIEFIGTELRDRVAALYRKRIGIKQISARTQISAENVRRVLDDEGLLQLSLPFKMDETQFAELYRTTVTCGHDGCRHSVDAEHGYNSNPWDMLVHRMYRHVAVAHRAWGETADDLLAAVGVDRVAVKP